MKKLNLHYRDSIDQNNDIIAVIAVFSIYPQLVDYFKIIFTPVFEINAILKARGWQIRPVGNVRRRSKPILKPGVNGYLTTKFAPSHRNLVHLPT
jgi:hypothetical protein